MTDTKVPTFWYFGLEPLKERYTYQLSEEWMPDTYQKDPRCQFIHIRGDKVDDEIKVGQVLDAFGRGCYAMTQCQRFMRMIQSNAVKDGDIIFLQDFWTPGMDAVFYMLDLYGINVRLYSMLHAQSVDEYDFTHSMKDWMRHYELGLDSRHSGIFVGSTIHKEQLRAAGFKAPIHVISLPAHRRKIKQVIDGYEAQDKLQVIYTSRLDKEKNPYFLAEVIAEFLNRQDEFNFVITTSGKELRSNMGGVVETLYELAAQYPGRLKILTNLTKEQYYRELADSRVQFNCALQDYVSWTLIESTIFGCDVVYPNFRSFPEILPAANLYPPFRVHDAVDMLVDKCFKREQHLEVGMLSDLGRNMQREIILGNETREFNVWHEHSAFIDL